MKRICLFIVAVITVLQLTGCISEPNASKFARDGTQSLHEISRAILGAGRAQEGANQGMIDVYETNLEKRVSTMNVRMDRMVAEAEENTKRFKNLALDLAQLAGAAFPGGSIVTSIISSLAGLNDAASEEASENVDALRTDLEGELEELETSQAKADKDITAINAQVDSLKTQYDALIAESKKDSPLQESLEAMSELVKGMNSDEQDKLRTRILAEVALSSEAEQAAQAAIYGVPHAALGETGPSVSPLNGVVASLAATDFMVAVTGMAEPRRLINYAGHLLRLTTAKAPESDCPFCKGIRGSGGSADVERYLRQ